LATLSSSASSYEQYTWRHQAATPQAACVIDTVLIGSLNKTCVRHASVR